MTIADLAPRFTRSRTAGIGSTFVLSALSFFAALWLGGILQASVASASGPLAATLLEHVDVGRSAPGHVAETILMAASLLLAAVAPALASGAFARRWRRAALTSAALYPAWVAVMFAPACVIYAYAGLIDPGHLAARLFGDFLVLLSASVAAVTLVYALWARQHAEVECDLVGDILFGRTQTAPAAFVLKPFPRTAEAA